MDVETIEKKITLDEPLIKRFKHSVITQRIEDPKFQDSFRRHWHERLSIANNDITIITEPFRICKISNFIADDAFMDDLKVELADVKSRRQSMDLYQFEQTSDLANCDTSNVRRLWETFRTDVAQWMEKNTMIPLNGKISMSSSVYYDTDYLLCHDDNLSDRRIAFILYLSKDWHCEDGGTLDLFDTDDNGAPRSIQRSLVPEYNSLIFFEVHDDSYHQVAEIKSSEKSRWTINGWFHGPIVPSSRKIRSEITPIFKTPDTLKKFVLSDWIRECYLDADVAKNVQKNVETNSYTFLSNFLNQTIYEKLSSDIGSDKIIWQRMGPPDVRNYEIARVDSLPEKLRDFYRLFGNIEIFRLLKDYTELDLVPGFKDMGYPKMSIELQRWSNGCYTLMCDKSEDDKIAGMRGEEERLGCNGEGKIVASRGEEMVENLEKTSTAGVRGSKREKRDTRKIEKENNKRTDKENAAKDDKKIEDIASSSSIGVSGDGQNGVVLKRLLRGKTSAEKKLITQSLQRGSSSRMMDEKIMDCPESEDSDVSDIGDYLSDRFERSIESDEDEDEDEDDDDDDDDCSRSSSNCEPGSLDVIMQFNTADVPSDETIDYIDSNQQEGALIHVPFKDNHLCIAYKTISTTRLHKYVNHYCKGYFYNLICTYYE